LVGTEKLLQDEIGEKVKLHITFRPREAESCTRLLRPRPLSDPKLDDARTVS
jgi:hypothetical protein